MTTNTSQIDPVFIARNRQIVADFVEESGYEVDFVDGTIWPMDRVGSAQINLLAARLRKNPDFSFSSSSFQFLREGLDDLKFHDAFMFHAESGFERDIVFYRPANGTEVRNRDVNAYLTTKKKQENFATFSIYHELFHIFDCNVTRGFKNDAHRQEFFCDFAACLIMARDGEDMFLPVAKWRALNLKKTILNIHYDLDKQEKEDIKKCLKYANHHLYGAYKKWRHDNPDIDITELDLNDILTIAQKVTRQYALKAPRLDRFVNRVYQAQTVERPWSSKEQKDYNQLDIIKRRGIGNWKEKYTHTQ